MNDLLVGILIGFVPGIVAHIAFEKFRQQRVANRSSFSPSKISQMFTTSQKSDELYRTLLKKTMGDRATVERLLEFERKRTPNANREQLLRSAIERWQHDNR